MEKQAIHYDDVKRIFGDITGHKAAEIIESGVSISELEKIRILLSDDTDQTQEFGRLSPKSQNIYNLLRRDQEQWEIDR